MTNKTESSKFNLLGSKEKAPLKKEILEDISAHNSFAIISSTGNQDIAIVLVTKGEKTLEYGLYQLDTIASAPLKKGVEQEVAERFYIERMKPVIQMLKANGIKSLILDYNLSFWAHVKNTNLATFIINNSGAETVWTYPKTRIAKPETLMTRGGSLLTESGTIALSFLKSYIPESLKEIDIFNDNLDESIKTALEQKQMKFTVLPEDVFDRKKEKDKEAKIQALTWALNQSEKIRNPKYVKVFQELLESTKEPVLPSKKKKK